MRISFNFFELFATSSLKSSGSDSKAVDFDGSRGERGNKPRLADVAHFDHELPPLRSPCDFSFAVHKRSSSWFHLGTYLSNSSDSLRAASPDRHFDCAQRTKSQNRRFALSFLYNTYATRTQLIMNTRSHNNPTSTSTSGHNTTANPVREAG